MTYVNIPSQSHYQTEAAFDTAQTHHKIMTQEHICLKCNKIHVQFKGRLHMATQRLLPR